MPDTDLGARLYLALVKHGLLATYREHGGGEGGTVDGPICVLHPRSLGALVRLLSGYSCGVLVEWTYSKKWWCGHYNTSDSPEESVARALLLALGEAE